MFAARQTDGDGEIPDSVRPQLLTGGGPEGAWDALAALIRAQGFSVRTAPLAPANGTTDRTARCVTIADRLDEAAAVKTLAHELAHVLLHCGPTFAYIANRGRYECEAESVAYMVCDALGVASDAYSFGYVAHWSGGDPKVVEKAAERAMTCAREILADLSEQASEVALAA